jgi:hypothetical protein
MRMRGTTRLRSGIRLDCAHIHLARTRRLLQLEMDQVFLSCHSKRSFSGGMRSFLQSLRFLEGFSRQPRSRRETLSLKPRKGLPLKRVSGLRNHKVDTFLQVSLTLHWPRIPREHARSARCLGPRLPWITHGPSQRGAAARTSSTFNSPAHIVTLRKASVSTQRPRLPVMWGLGLHTSSGRS